MLKWRKARQGNGNVESRLEAVFLSRRMLKNVKMDGGRFRSLVQDVDNGPRGAKSMLEQLLATRVAVWMGG